MKTRKIIFLQIVTALSFILSSLAILNLAGWLFIKDWPIQHNFILNYVTYLFSILGISLTFKLKNFYQSENNREKYFSDIKDKKVLTILEIKAWPDDDFSPESPSPYEVIVSIENIEVSYTIHLFVKDFASEEEVKTTNRYIKFEDKLHKI